MTYDRIALQKDLEDDEGLRLKPYQCSEDKTTIGIGRNLDDVGITKEEAFYLLGNDIDRCDKQLDQYLPWWRTLSDRRQRALLNQCFQLGIGGLLKFSKMLGALQAGDWPEAYRQALDSRWYAQTPERAKRVAELFL
jgi:lysozyme